MSVWLLPENIADMLPREARAIEHLRSSFLKLVTSHGFEVVRPPLVEYVDSLLTGTGGDLDLRTFKIVDQVTGKTMGIRADMTPGCSNRCSHSQSFGCIPPLLCWKRSPCTSSASSCFAPAVLGRC